MPKKPYRFAQDRKSDPFDCSRLGCHPLAKSRRLPTIGQDQPKLQWDRERPLSGIVRTSAAGAIHPRCEPEWMLRLALGERQLSEVGCSEADVPLSAEAVWQVGDLVVSGVEPEVADGGLC